VSGTDETANLQSLTVKQAAALMNVSERSVYLARRVCREGIPELEQEVMAGRLNIHCAVRLLKFDHESQRRLVGLVREGGQRMTYLNLLKMFDPKPRTNYPPLLAAWDKATAGEREALLEYIGGR